MKIIRRGLILLLFCANLVLLVYVLHGIKEPMQEIPAANVTVVKAREQTAAEEHPDFVKEEYVLVLPEGKNVAVDKPISASSFNDVYAANKANDGNAGDASYWEGKNEYPNTLTIDLEAPIPIHTIRLCLNPMDIWGTRTQEISVKISQDGTNYTELVGSKEYTFDPAAGNEAQIPFDEVEAQYVQLEITSNSGANGGQIAEFEIYSR